jgi:IrrE N-terminal-like domain
MDKETIRQTLSKTLLQLNPHGNWPVNPHGILSRLGIGLRYEEKKVRAESHLLLGTPPTIIIYRRNSNLLLSTKERFSIAHELAHWIVWRRFGFLPSSETYWDHETLCNEFAAQLLVPPPALQRFLEKQYSEQIDPIYFPRKVAGLAAVSWEVAAKSITKDSSAESAYLRLERISPIGSLNRWSLARPGDRFRVNCSTVTNMSGSFVGRRAHVREGGEIVQWMETLANGRLECREATLTVGGLQLTNVPCSFLREDRYWVLRFHPSSKGIKIDDSNPRTAKLNYRVATGAN